MVTLMKTLLLLTSTFVYISGEMTAPGLERLVSDGVNSMGFNIMYGDDHLTVINEVVREGEKLNDLMPKTNSEHTISPLPAEDVKCLMSVDRYCSKEMVEIKNILIHALKEDCVKCTEKQKEDAGKIVASMMAHDPSAWKFFLTRSAVQILPKKNRIKVESPRFRIIGEPEIVDSKKKYLMHGAKVRVKRYAMEKIN